MSKNNEVPLHVTLKFDGKDVEFVRKDSSEAVQTLPGQSMYQLGVNLIIRTVTFIYIGKVTFVSESEVVLEDASWIADTGRFSDALSKGSLNEIEPYPGPCSVSKGGIVDSSPWCHELPRKQK